jgi:hypothetical protein
VALSSIGNQRLQENSSFLQAQKKLAESHNIGKKILRNKSSFPKRVGVIFAENPYKKERILNFDQDPCTFFLLQMNKYQTTFEFQIITPYHEPPESNEKLESWFIEEIKTFQKNLENNNNHIHYWLGVTSKEFYQRIGWYFYEVRKHLSQISIYG